MFQKKIKRRNVSSPHNRLEPLTVVEKSNALPTELAGLKYSASLTNIIFQFQEFEAVAPEINNLLYIFFAAISDFEVLLFSLLGVLDPTTFRLTAERVTQAVLWRNLLWLKLLWRNRLARSAVNRKVVGSSQPRSENSRTSKSEIAAKNMSSKLLISGATASNS